MKKDGALMLPWSISRLKDYERCPLYAYEVHVNKNRSPSSPALDRGIAIHTIAERYVNAKRPRLPAQLVRHGAQFKRLRKLPFVATELKFGLTASWKVTEFFGRDVWARGVMDVFATVKPTVAGLIVDHKSGRRYPEHVDQLRVYGVAGFAIEPSFKTFDVEAWYLDLGDVLTFTITPGDAEQFKHDLVARVKKMTSDKLFAPRPNSRCKWCHLSTTNGGTCKAWL